jgi:NADH:ubiquinone oxidoreductase subunit 6 (subunit J)
MTLALVFAIAVDVAFCSVVSILICDENRDSKRQKARKSALFFAGWNLFMTAASIIAAVKLPDQRDLYDSLAIIMFLIVLLSCAVLVVLGLMSKKLSDFDE